MGSTNRRIALPALILCIASALACGPENGLEGGGSIGIQLQIAPGVTINTVDWSIVNAGIGFAQSGSVNEQFSNTIVFQVGGLPAATGYAITLTAMSVGGTFSCSGTSSFDVTAGATTHVGIVLTCSPTGGGGGTIVVDGTTVICANIDSISVFPLETTVGHPIALVATASAGGVATSFAWTAPAGTFDNPGSATPTFTCPAAPQMVDITLTVSPGVPQCPTTTSRTVTVTCDTLNPTFTNVYASVIGARCTGCHRPGGSGVTVGKLDMSTQAAAYANLVGVAAAGTGAGASGVMCAALSPPILRVSPNQSAMSLLVDKVASKLEMRNPACGSPMPLPTAAAPLTAAQVDLIRAWIDGGAQND